MLKKVRLELARSHEHPDGARNIGYEFAAPLNDKDRIDPNEWQKQRDHCRVRRFRPGEEDDIGHLVRKPGGSWAFHYDIHSDEEDDESGYRFGDHEFRAGEYVSVKEDDELHTYKIVRVQPVS
ncbi:MAG: hypothetical protein ACKVP5_21390 [Aestuariivirga sp.]